MAAKLYAGAVEATPMTTLEEAESAALESLSRCLTSRLYDDRSHLAPPCDVRPCPLCDASACIRMQVKSRFPTRQRPLAQSLPAATRGRAGIPTGMLRAQRLFTHLVR